MLPNLVQKQFTQLYYIGHVAKLSYANKLCISVTLISDWFLTPPNPVVDVEG